MSVVFPLNVYVPLIAYVAHVCCLAYFGHTVYNTRITLFVVDISYSSQSGVVQIYCGWCIVVVHNGSRRGSATGCGIPALSPLHVCCPVRHMLRRYRRCGDARVIETRVNARLIVSHLRLLSLLGPNKL